jgi:hypothetical protein
MGQEVVNVLLIGLFWHFKFHALYLGATTVLAGAALLCGTGALRARARWRLGWTP